jgi:hypothetical protein
LPKKETALKRPSTFTALCGRDYKNLVRNIFPQTDDPAVHTNTSATKQMHLDPRINSQRCHAGTQATLPVDAGDFDLLSGLGFAKRHQDALRTRRAVEVSAKVVFRRA